MNYDSGSKENSLEGILRSTRQDLRDKIRNSFTESPGPLIPPEQEKPGLKEWCKVNIDPGFPVKEVFSSEYVYQALESNFARFTLASLMKKYSSDMISVNYASPSEQPSTIDINTDYNCRTRVPNNILLHVPGGLIAAKFDPQECTYTVVIVGNTKEKLNEYVQEYNILMQSSNFYTGKCLKFEKNGPAFFKPPETTFADVVFEDKLIRDYKANTIDFLSNEKSTALFKKRAVILSGPPGTGKTSIVAATFNYCRQKNLTSIFLTDESFHKVGINDIFDFIGTYLSPCVVCFEDVDLIGGDRVSNHSRFIGTFLSALNGLEEFKKPIVILATTNRFEVLDSAVTRPCRFDRHFKVDYPKKNEIFNLFKLIFKTDSMPEKILKKVGKITGAHLREIYSTSKLMEITKGGNYKDYIEEAVDVVIENFYLSSGSGVGFLQEEDECCEKSPEVQGTIPDGRSKWVNNV